MTVHIGTKPQDIAETCLLPGDPYRARWAAENFLDNPKLVNETRGMLGFTGTYKGNPVTIQGTGMGRPSISIYVNELITAFDVKTLIRVGSTGAIADQTKLRDLVIAMTASTPVNINASWLGDIQFAPCADFDLLKRAVQLAKTTPHVGGVYTGDLFYESSMDIYEKLKSHGVLSVDMETAELYTLASRHNRHALSIMTVSDHILREEELSSAEREQSFGEMIELALETAFHVTQV